ncbi:COG4315 family predicted lipoprotein [Actinacidiphila acididurans]|uniref:Lipoprotein with Yx(FWY)xxD motif n=1 Tax=Actinacidiphila acididurans TaxID=2784346 RepID=A0ABS2TY45_9ACTN|nr:hypothetical protein [Actinacidiphila acididurans]MBM9508274.1 hypothetical protein [Actinacidiphila acididurans]
MKRAFPVAVCAATLLLTTALSGCGSTKSSSASSQASDTASAGSSASPSTQEAAATASGSPTASTQATVTTRAVGNLGTVLVDGRGRTLYLFKADTTSKSTCNDGCAVAWPPLLTTGKAKQGQGVQSGLLGTSMRSDGGTQVTYNKHPLYMFSGDSKAGDSTGQGLTQFGAQWFVVNTAGNAVTR